MSETPRTDEYLDNRTPSDGPTPDTVSAEFARQLERERNALTAAIKNWLKVKGRHNSQIAAARLAELVGEPFAYPEGKKQHEA